MRALPAATPKGGDSSRQKHARCRPALTLVGHPQLDVQPVVTMQVSELCHGDETCVVAAGMSLSDSSNNIQ